jgi:hypothetical protein
MSDQQSTGQGWSEGTPTDEAQQPEFPVNGGFDTYGEEYESAPSVPAEDDGTEDYAAASYPGERWDTAPAVDGIAEQAWDYAKEQANEFWEWATEGSESEQRPSDGGGGGEGGPPSYDDGGGGGYGPSDAGVPGGVPDAAYCDHSGGLPGVCRGTPDVVRLRLGVGPRR